MITPRAALLTLGLAFALAEAVDAPLIEVPAFAVLFSGLFLAATAWFWRRESNRAAVALLLLFAFEIAEAPSWKDTSLGVKMLFVALGLAGIIAGTAQLITRERARA